MNAHATRNRKSKPGETPKPTSLPLPDTGFVRIWQILGCKKRNIVAHIPESSATWWECVKNHTRPQPLKLGPNTTVWRVEDIRQFIADGEWKTPGSAA